MNKPESGPNGVIAYRRDRSLYLNLTNRCSNDCVFCAKGGDYRLWGNDLGLRYEPSFAEIIEAIGNPADYREVVFCGFGEPTYRAETIVRVARWLKANGAKRVRLNTNGHADLINGRDILPEFSGLIDAVSISLNAEDAETYENICRPQIADAYPAVLDFIRRAKEFIPEVTASIVAFTEADQTACEKIAADLGVEFRLR